MYLPPTVSYTPIWFVNSGYLSVRDGKFFLHYSDGYEMPVSCANAIGIIEGCNHG